MSKSNKIIKLAAFALIGYGVYKAFFAEDNDGNATTYSSASASSGSGVQSRGSSSHYVSERGELSDSEYAEYQAQAAAEKQQQIAELTERLEKSTDESEKVAIQRQLNSLRSTTSHR